MKSIPDWLDERTGWRQIFNRTLYENIPGGSRWRYVWGSTLMFTLSIQFITGVFLWMTYSPSSQTAWESVFYVQNEMLGGWLLRGLHHYTAQVMNVLLVLHLMQVVLDGAYRAPREINFWFGFFLLQIVLALSLTGYLLPWDQKGFWATKVTTNIMGIVPFAGPILQRLIIGGAEYGHHTLTRFFALHAGVLPATVILLVFWHIYLFRRHGITAKDPKRNPDEKFWPDQVLKDAVACLAVLATVLFLIVRPRLFHPGAEMGAELTAPADASEPYSAARPEWYFLFLFQFLKYFPGNLELVGAVIIPGIAMGILFLMPFLGRWQLGHRFNLCYLFSVLVGVGLLTYLAIAQDKRDPVYQVALREVEQNATRVKVLARAATGIPSEGAASLLRNDSLTQGPKLFARNCASCHRYDGHDGLGNQVKDAQSASDLKGFASREWLAGLLDPERIATVRYFGGTKHKDGKMAGFVNKKVAKYSAEQKEELKKVIIAVSSEARLRSQLDADARDASAINEGRSLLKGDIACTDCHQFHVPDEDATAPDLTGYGSRQWLVGMISNPAHEKYYGKRNDRMPRFGEEQILSLQAIGLLADWLRQDWYEPTNHGTWPARTANVKKE
jgi:ubiquinol-cytochrome c reductase cytochrome b subunit